MRPVQVAATGSNKQRRIPLNDDAQEKAKRMQSRHALHDIHMNQLKAAASPMRKVQHGDRAGSSSPKTPRRSATADKENIFADEITVGGSAVTPMKRSVPLLANFEEWMKLATDNKINANNSWNFALIDYFHDMSLLKEGNGVNFQKASCTLDGCVKIYTSRVDSVATETGKLLSGLAESRDSKKKRGGDGEDGEAGEESEEEVDEDGTVRKKPKKKTQRSSEATLAPSFASLQLKKFELEFSVDPLFKKMSADFDEGGAKGLLLNHLSIDSEGKIVFDSSDDVNDATTSKQRKSRKEMEEEEEEDEGTLEPDSILDETAKPTEEEEDVEIDIGSLGARFFPNLAILDEQDICPTLKNFDLGDVSGSTDIPFLKAAEDWRAERDKTAEPDTAHGDASGVFLDEDNPVGFDDDDDGLLGDFGGEEPGFGEGGEVWAREAAIEPQMRPVNHDINGEDGEVGEEGVDNVGNFDPDSSKFVVSLNHKSGGGHEDILAYFDTALQKNWAGPEHWRIRKIKDSDKPAGEAKKRKEKEPFEIDFAGPMTQAVADAIYTPATSSAAISMPKKDWKSKTRNLLPDDKHFNSKQLLRLFLKPKASMGSKQSGLGRRPIFGQQPTDAEPEGEMDEAFWAQKEAAIIDPPPEDAPKGDYDANFFDDNDGAAMGGMDDDDEFADARDHFSPAPGEGDVAGAAMGGLDAMLAGSEQPAGEGAFGTQLVTQSRRMRPEYVQYARVAKKVDVRRLKEELWRGLGAKGLHAVSLDTTDVTLPATNAMNRRSSHLKQTVCLRLL
jgi:condensin complex subunit 2